MSKLLQLGEESSGAIVFAGPHFTIVAYRNKKGSCPALEFLDQHKTGAGDIFFNAQSPGQSLGKNSFSGAQLAGQGHHVVGPQAGRQFLPDFSGDLR